MVILPSVSINCSDLWIMIGWNLNLKLTLELSRELFLHECTVLHQLDRNPLRLKLWTSTNFSTNYWQICRCDCRAVLWLVQILLEDRNFRHIGFPSNWRTTVHSCANNKFSPLVIQQLPSNTWYIRNTLSFFISRHLCFFFFSIFFARPLS